MTIAQDYRQLRHHPLDSSLESRAPIEPPRSAAGPRLGMLRVEQAVGDGYGHPAQHHAPESMLSLDVVDMDSEIAYWRSHYRGLVSRTGLRYADHEPAVKLGLDAYMRGHGRRIEEMHDELQACYRRTRGVSRLDWDEARPIVEAVWRRLCLRGRDRVRR